MVKFYLALIIMVLISGCSSKEEKQLIESYSAKMMHYKKLQQTEKLLLYENNITKVVLTATYLYDKRQDRGSENNETFIIGLNIADKDTVNMREIFGLRDLKQVKRDSDIRQLKISSEKNVKDYDYSLTLKGKKAISIETLALDDRRLDQLSFVSEWNTYALVTFKYIKNNRFTMIFSSKMYGNGKLVFAKKAKYTF